MVGMGININDKLQSETGVVLTKEDALKNVPDMSEVKSVFLHNFSNKEISLILKAVNTLYPDKRERKKLVFAKTTETSLQMKVKEWIEDTAEDHLYLLENPPNIHSSSPEDNQDTTPQS